MGSWQTLPAVPNGGAIDLSAPIQDDVFVLDTLGNIWLWFRNYTHWTSQGTGSGYNRIAVGSDLHMFLAKPNDNHIYTEGYGTITLPTGTKVAELSASNMFSVFVVTSTKLVKELLPSASTTIAIHQPLNKFFNQQLDSVLQNAPPGQTLAFSGVATATNTCTGPLATFNWAFNVQTEFCQAMTVNEGGFGNVKEELGFLFRDYNTFQHCTAATTQPDLQQITGGTPPARNMPYPHADSDFGFLLGGLCSRLTAGGVPLTHWVATVGLALEEPTDPGLGDCTHNP